MRDDATDAPARQPKLKPANENPWYVLMTLAGEQEGSEIDDELQKRNAKLWNLYSRVVPGSSGVERAKKHGLVFESDGTRGVTSRKIHDGFLREWNKRNGPDTPAPTMPRPEEQVNLSGTDFENLFSVNNMYFNTELNLKGARFQKGALFIECGFVRTVDLSDAEISGRADFENSCFSADVYAENLNIVGNFDFGGAAVDGNLNMTWVLVSGPACMEKLVVKGDTVFERCRFCQSCDFYGSKFEGSASFNTNVFTESVSFAGSDFSDRSSFSMTEFFETADFSGSDFFGVATFRGASFSSEAKFSTATFHDRADFGEAVFRGRSKKDAVESASPTRFAATDFKGPVDFSYAKFTSSYPDFSGAVMPEKAAFSARSKHWPDAIKQGSEQAKDCCAIVRHILSKQGLPEDEHFFFRREMHFAGQIGSWWQRFPYRAFGLLSDYGHSIARPAIALFALWLVPALVYMAVFAWEGALHGKEHGMFEPFGLSFSNVFRIFGFQRTHFGADYVRDLHNALEGLAAVQTIFGFVFLFLLGLGLRQRFRLR